MSNVIGYIIPKEFKGSCLSMLCKATTGHEFVAYCNLSLAEYLKQHEAEGAHVVTPEEFDVLYAAHLQTYVSAPQVVDAERYDYLLEVLPPCRWTNVGGVEIFHISERITGNMVTWCAQYNGVYFEFVDADNKAGKELSDKVKAAYLAIKKEVV